MNKKILTALALMLGSAAGAQCVQPVIPTLPRFANTGYSASNFQGAGAIAPWQASVLRSLSGYGVESNGSVQMFYNYADTANAYTVPLTMTLPGSAITSFDMVRYLKLGMVWSNNGTIVGGNQRIITISYGGVPYARIYTTKPTATQPQIGFITGLNGAVIYDGAGNVATQTDPNGNTTQLGMTIESTRGVGVTNLDARDLYTSTDPQTQYRFFSIRLPDSARNTPGDLVFSAIADDGGAASVDDFAFLKPEVVPTTLCLQKRITNGAPAGDYTFSLNNTGNPNNVATIAGVTAEGTTYSQQTAAQVFGNNVSVTELLAGNYGISSITCNSVLSPYATSSLVQPKQAVNATSKGSKAFDLYVPDGTQTTCTITNDGTPAPSLTTNKTFPSGRFPTTDQATITATSGSNSKTYSTTGTGSAVSYTTTDRTVSAPATYATPTSSGLRADLSSTVTQNRNAGGYTFTSSETVTTPGNYAATYSCTNANTASTTALPSGSGTSLSVTGASFGDNITCTFVNTLTVATPKTTVNISKTGPTVVAVGAPTGTATYVITVSVPSGVTQSYIVLKDKITLANGTLLPASAVTAISPNGTPGTFDEATQTVTFPITRAGSPSSNPYEVTIQLPSKTENSVDGDTYTGPNLITDTATVETYTDATATTPITNTGTASATVSTNLLFAQVRKTVRNVTQGGTAGTSAEAGVGDVLEYCLNYTNQSAVAMNLTLRDELVAGQTLVADSFTGGTNTGSGNQVSVAVPGVAAGGTGSVCFQTTVNE